VGTSIINGTFRDNWNFRSKMCMLLDLLWHWWCQGAILSLKLVGLELGWNVLFALIWTKLCGQTLLSLPFILSLNLEQKSLKPQLISILLDLANGWVLPSTAPCMCTIPLFSAELLHFFHKG
jgi:hypothetical protein